MKTGIIIFFSLTAVLCEAQVSFYIRASVTNEPLVGATAIVTDNNGEKSEHLISDANGRMTTDFDLPFMVQLRYVGFKTTSYEITDHHQSVYLNPSELVLEEVVITGQYQPQSAKNSVYMVRSISADRIEAQSANSVHDVLSNELNIRIQRDNATGRSGISMQGMSGQYVKVLVDGIPLIGKGGVSNDLDLSQVDINTVERIEIVEGPMAVDYGADALAGVINIITTKDSKGKVELNAGFQAETVGNEFTPFQEGIYNPSLSLGFNPNSKWYSQINGRFNRFGGWQGSNEGREKQWHPKDQFFGGGLLRYSQANWDIYYKLDFMDELITSLGAIVEADNKEPSATDEEYHAVRFIHQLQSDLKIGDASLNSVFSFTDYERLSTNYKRFLDSDTEVQLSNGNDTIYYRSFFSRNKLNLFQQGNAHLQLGLEVTNEISGGSTLNSGDKELTDVAGFVSAEFILDKLKIRPGIRYSYNSLFKTIPTPSINLSFKANEQTQFRLSYGRGFRAPSIRELYHEFIDSNHRLIGNPDLSPEYSHNFNFDVSHQMNLVPISIKFGSFYNDISNQITFYTTTQNNQETTYINLLEYKTLGSNLRASFEKGNVNASMGFSYIGRYQLLRSNENVPNYLFSPELVSRVQYNFSKPRIQVSAFYKFNGASQSYQLDENDEPQKQKVENYHTLDANLSKSLGERLKLAIGARNILNVTNLNSAASSGAHGSNGGVSVGYGRSYFFRINYQIKQ